MMLAAVLLPLVAVAHPANAAGVCDIEGHKSWVGAANGVWSEPLNWEPVGVPTATDSVCIDANGPVNLDIAAEVLNLESTQTVVVGAGLVVGTYINSGTLIWNDGPLSIATGFSNTGTVQLNGGSEDSFVINDGASLDNAGTIVASGAGPHIAGLVVNQVGSQLQVSANGLSVAELISAGSDISVSGGALIITAPTFTVSDGSTLTLAGEGSSVSVGGGIGDLVIEPGGTLTGSGVIQASVDNFGTISVSSGVDSGHLVVMHNMNARSGSIISTSVQGPVAGADYGQLSIVGSLQAGGAVSVSVSGYSPVAGDALQIIAASNPNGQFSTVTSNFAVPGLVLTPQWDGSGLTLNVIPDEGTISGFVFNDSNGNGARDGDSGFAGVTVYADLDFSGDLSVGDISAVSDANGSYSLSSVPSGSVHVRVITDSSVVVTTATPATQTVVAGGNTGNVNIGLYVKASISGVAFVDTNGDKVRSTGEPASSGVRIYIDANNNWQFDDGSESSVLTAADGSYEFSGLVPGAYRVRVDLMNGYVLSTSQPTFTPRSGNELVADFGLYKFSTISGTVYEDLDGNGKRDVRDKGIGGRLVFLDKNGDGIFNGTDSATTTASNGTYVFTGLIGAQNVVVQLVGDEKQTPNRPLQVALTSGSSATGRDIGVYDPPDLQTHSLRNDPFAAGGGYWMAAADGGVFGFGTAAFYGSMGGLPLNQPIVGFDPTPSGLGYRLVASDGGVFSFGDARFYGSMGGQRLNKPMVAMASTTRGAGYWTVASDGGVFSFGDAQFYGSMGGQHLNSPIVGMVPTSTDQGYWQVAEDGGIFAFGNAPFHGSAQAYHGNHRVVGMASVDDGGYWIVDEDGGIYAFGNAQFHGSLGGQRLAAPVVAIRAVADGSGYWLFLRNGEVYPFGSATFFGEMDRLNSPIIG